MKVSIKQKVKNYLFTKRRWVSHQELEKQSDNFLACSSTIMRESRKLYETDPNIDRKYVNYVVYYKFTR